MEEREGQEAEDLRQEPPPCMITGPKSRAGRRRLARGAFSGQFSHDQAEVEREDAAQVAFVVIDPAAQGGAPQAAAVEDVVLTMLRLLQKQTLASRWAPELMSLYKAPG